LALAFLVVIPEGESAVIFLPFLSLPKIRRAVRKRASENNLKKAGVFLATEKDATKTPR
jgi:hypothetical protein